MCLHVVESCCIRTIIIKNMEKMAAEYVLKHVLKYRYGPLVLSTFVTGVRFVSLRDDSSR